MNAVIARGEDPAYGVSTEFTGDEVNAYLQLRLTAKFPAGVTEPSVSLLDQGRLNGSAVVDLDGIRREEQRRLVRPGGLPQGQAADGRLGDAEDRGGQRAVPPRKRRNQRHPDSKDAAAGGRQLLHADRPEMPGGVNLDAPFDLPSQIQRIDVVTNKATVVQ